jgi:hypothetical protein
LNGTEYERMGDGVEAFTALSYTMPKCLIYRSRIRIEGRLKFLKKDSISKKTKGKMFMMKNYRAL